MNINTGISRRRVLQGAGATAGLIGLGGFGSTARAQSTETGNLTVLATADTQAYLEYLKNRFAEDFPNVTVEIQTVGYDQLYTRVSSLMASSSSAVDVLEMDLIWTADFARNGWATPLNEFVTAEEMSQFREGLLTPFTSEGKVLGLPAATVFKTMFYNTELLQKLGLSAPPSTYEELVEIGKTIKSGGVTNFVQGFGWTQAEGLVCDWTQILAAFGGTWFENGKWAFNNDAGVTALTYMVDNLNSQVFDPASVTYNDRTVMNPFFVGDYLAMFSWGLWGWNMSSDPKESQVAGKVGVGLTYGTKQAGVKSATCAGGGANVINPNSKSRDLAVEWVKRAAGINRRENQEFLLRETGTLPTLASIWEDPNIAQINPAAAALSEQSKYLVARPGNYVVGYQAWSQVLQVELTSALTFQKSPKEALDAAVQRSNTDFQPFGL